MKKKLLKSSLFFVILLCIIFISTISWYFLSTMSPNQCYNYCTKNSIRDSNDFMRIDTDDYTQNYSYYIAKNQNSSKPQEMFIFKKFYWGPFHFDRYRLILRTTSDNNNYNNSLSSVGSVQFSPRKDNGEKESGSTIIFFGSSADSNMRSYEYTLKTNNEEKLFKENMTSICGVWFIRFSDLNNDVDEKSKKELMKVDFLDETGNIIYTYEK